MNVTFVISLGSSVIILDGTRSMPAEQWTIKTYSEHGNNIKIFVFSLPLITTLLLISGKGSLGGSIMYQLNEEGCNCYSKSTTHNLCGLMQFPLLLLTLYEAVKDPMFWTMTNRSPVVASASKASM